MRRLITGSRRLSWCGVSGSGAESSRRPTHKRMPSPGVIRLPKNPLQGHRCSPEGRSVLIGEVTRGRDDVGTARLCARGPSLSSRSLIVVDPRGGLALPSAHLSDRHRPGLQERTGCSVPGANEKTRPTGGSVAGAASRLRHSHARRVARATPLIASSAPAAAGHSPLRSGWGGRRRNWNAAREGDGPTHEI